MDADALRHQCDTLPGSSGALIFAQSDGALVALHHLGGLLASDALSFNQGVDSTALKAASAAFARLVSAQAVPRKPDAEAEAALEWQALDKASIAMLETFLERHGASRYGSYAQARIAEIKRVAQASAPPTPPPVMSAPTLPAKPSSAPLPPTAVPATPKTLNANRAPTPLSAAELAVLKPKDVFRECKDCPEMVVIPPGTFIMGSSSEEVTALTKEYGTAYEKYFQSETPQHDVTIANAFAVGKFTVTFDEWTACVQDGGCQGNKVPRDEGWGKVSRPVINVFWDDAQEYVTWLNGKVSGRPYRLLSEAEWEYAARAGTTSIFYWGNDIGISKNLANCSGCGSQWDNKQTAPVGSFASNAFGLHDMHGNVFQWVQDCFIDHDKDAPKDGSAVYKTPGCDRGVRGGAWNTFPGLRRSASRIGFYPSYMDNILGFRVARTLAP